MPLWLPLVLAAPLLAGLLWAERCERPARILVFKTPLSALFVLTACLHAQVWLDFRVLILVALIACLLGDVLLAFQSRKTFLAGLVAFLLGHLLYVVSFFGLGYVGGFTWLGALITGIAAIVVWRWLLPHLGRMRLPVAAYILAIAAMVTGAFTIWGTPLLPFRLRLFVLLGAIFFFVSDLAVARNRFVKKEFNNYLWGLPLYYAGQFLIALSVFESLL